MLRYYILLTVIFLSNGLSLSFANQKNLIFTIDLKKDVGGTTWLYIQKGFDEAIDKNASDILIHMNTYGGEVLYADSIRTRILNSKIPVSVFIDNNAASAGALIALACKNIYMRKGATIGAVTVVNQSGEAMPDKYQSYMRATMRATAEAHGKDTIVDGKDTVYVWKRNPLIAEAMVDDRTEIPGINEKGKTLTFTAEEALKHGYCDGIAENVEEVIEHQLKYSSYTIDKFKPTTWDDIKGFLMSSVVQGILIMLIIGGIYFELQTPGIGFPLIAAITAALLYFAPLYMDGLAANWEIIIFIIGLVLIALEIFVIPGFGVAGVSGIVLIVTGLTLSLIGNVYFNFDGVNSTMLGRAFLTVTLGLGFGFTLTIYLSNKIGQKGIFRKVALETTLDNESGFIGVSVAEKELIGKNGLASTVLRPSGKVRIDGRTYDAISENGFIEKNTPIQVIRYETGQVYVEAITSTVKES